MSVALIDYGCHSFTYQLAMTLRKRGMPIAYYANSSLQSPNLSSLANWITNSPDMVSAISCTNPYGKMGLYGRLRGELEWGHRCAAVLEHSRPDAVIASCVPLTALTTIHRWALRHKVPFIYWLQDMQGRAIRDLLGRKLGLLGRTLGAVAHRREQGILKQSDMVITIAPGHEMELPKSVLRSGRHALLENWANIQELPQYPVDNDWARRHNLSHTDNVIYSGTLGLKHDLNSFLALAQHFQSRPAVRIVIVSSDAAADNIRTRGLSLGLPNLIVLPFQAYADVPKVLASAAVLIAPLGGSAGAYCVPSKVLSYLCAGRATVIAIDPSNAAAQTIRAASAGCVVPPGQPGAFVASVEMLLNNRDMRLAAGRSARSYAELTFGMDNIVHRFLDIVQRAYPALTQEARMYSMTSV